LLTRSISRPSANVDLLVAHQPHFFPWAGYFNKVASAKYFALQDDVQFRRRYFQNRTIIRNPQGAPYWLTVPVHARQHTLLRDVTVASAHWADRALAILHHAYARGKHYREVHGLVSTWLSGRSKYLVDVNEKCIQSVCELLHIDAQILRTSEWPLETTRTRQLITICKTVHATGYIYGEGGGRRRHPPDAFHQAGIETLQQHYSPCFRRLVHRCDLVAYNASILELLYLFGVETTSRLIRTCWRA
jgi:hypothetical protein